LTREGTPFFLKGVYLTSAIQQATTAPAQYPQTVQADEFLQALQIMHTPSAPANAYFVRQFLLQGLVTS
jgi:hypothetical protein